VSRAWLLALLLLWAVPGRADQTEEATPVVLSRGMNITGWFRFPASRQPAALAGYMSDQALSDLRSTGFDFVRLAVDPDVVASTADRTLLTNAIRHIQRHGLAVIVSPHPHGWRLETGQADRDRLRDFWRGLAPALRPLDPARTVLEVLNEPVFPGDPDGWGALQHQMLGEIRKILPRQTVVLTGQDWGSIEGLLALQPEPDDAVLYSFHFYDPAELTSLAAYRPNLDRTALARLPFPAADRASCDTTADTAEDRDTGDLMRYYCALGWDRARLDAAIGRASNWARLHRVTLLAGEFGASARLNAPARLAWLQTVRESLQAHDIGWALWGYDDVMGLAVQRPPASHPSLDHDVLSALGLPTRF
jgi:endoglucanase